MQENSVKNHTDVLIVTQAIFYMAGYLLSLRNEDYQGLLKSMGEF